MRKGVIIGIMLVCVIMSGCGQEEGARNVELSPEGVENILMETIEIETVEIETKEIDTIPITIVTYDDVSTTWEDF